MIPKTDTSGAKDAGVPAFIDAALADALSATTDQERFKAGLAEFDAAVTATGKPFLEQEPAERSRLREACARDRADGRARSQALHPHDARAHAARVTSPRKVGITENMEYVAVPTVFHGCVPLSQMKKHVYWE